VYNPRVRQEQIFDHKGEIILNRTVCLSMTPALMRACQESRSEAVKHFSLVLGNSIYLDKSAGTVYLDNNRTGEFQEFVNSINKQELLEIENLAFNITEWSSGSFEFRNAIRKFSNLKTLAFMLGKGDDSYYSDKAAIKLIRKDLRLAGYKQGDTKEPLIIIVPSDKVVIFLRRERF
jgi:hypothetical protein